MPFDPNTAIGLGITGCTVLIGIGGAWRGVILGLRTLKEHNEQSTMRLEERLKELAAGVDAVHREFLTKELYAAQERVLLQRIIALEDRVNERRQRGRP